MDEAPPPKPSAVDKQKDNRRGKKGNRGNRGRASASEQTLQKDCEQASANAYRLDLLL
jgi:hypothetical protein